MLSRKLISQKAPNHTFQLVFKNYTQKPLYVQGQEPEPKIREYFYYVDHQGMLFLDDARMKNFTSCFKEKKFLKFFFNQLRLNQTKRYPEFPYISLCGRERNFLRCDDLPFVYCTLIRRQTEQADNEWHLTYNNTDVLTLKFQPEKIYMLPHSGRVYHPGPERIGHIGLVASKLANELSKQFTFEEGEANPPTHFHFEGSTYKLDTKWFSDAIRNKH